MNEAQFGVNCNDIKKNNIMTKLYFITGLMLAAAACTTAPKTTVNIHLEGAKISKAALSTQDSTYSFTTDSTGSALITLAENAKAGYASVRFGRAQIPVYIEPGKSFDMSVKFEARKITPTFTGEGAAKNEYLNTPANNYPDFKADEATFIKALETAEVEQIAKLEEKQFDSQFVQTEKRRIHYSIYSALPLYVSYHAYYAQDADYTPSENYYNALKASILEEPALIGLSEYKEALYGYICVTSYDLKARLDFTQKNFKDPAILEYLVDRSVMEHVGRNGVDNLDEFVDIYNAKVTSADKQAAFKTLCGKWAKIAKGQPCIEFKYKDINGKEVSLTDLAGKYVYIDCWATWCGPCRGELPHLQELEHKYKGKNIHFVSLSCDQDKAAWEKMVKDEKLGGIQLHNGGDRTFMDFFMVTGIPRFILLDREGKILQANASRPSNPETAKTFDALEGI